MACHGERTVSANERLRALDLPLRLAHTVNNSLSLSLLCLILVSFLFYPKILSLPNFCLPIASTFPSPTIQSTMDNNQATISNDPAANAPDAAAYKGKGKAVEDPSVAQEMSMDEDESEESENENEELVSLQ